MNVARILFSTLFLSLILAINVYLYRRLVRDVTKHRVLRWLGIAVLVATVVPVPLLRMLGRDRLPPSWAMASVLLWWGMALFTMLGLLTIGLARRVGTKLSHLPAPAGAPPLVQPEDPERRLFLARATAASALAFGGGMASFGAWRAFSPPEITEVPVRLLGLPKALDGFSIVQLSDIHVGAVIQERFLDQLVAVANSAKGDLLAITGDLVDGTPAQLGRFVSRLTNLQARYGRYFVSGNHDYYSGWDEWAPVVQSLGFEVLRNRRVSIGEGAASFDLVGVEDWGAPNSPHSEYDLEKATAGRDPSRAAVLMAHQPNGVELASAKNIGLQLSGHTHGGQLFPATLVGSLIWGRRNAGLSKLNDTFCYTSRGCGFVGPPVRVGAPPEVVKIVLVAG
jgi:predicted MPP superfamily phosphohydrolase